MVVSINIERNFRFPWRKEQNYRLVIENFNICIEGYLVIVSWIINPLVPSPRDNLLVAI